MFTGTPPTIRPSRCGRGRIMTAPEKKMLVCNGIYKDIYCYINCTSAAFYESNFNLMTNKQRTNLLSKLNRVLIEKVTGHLLV